MACDLRCLIFCQFIWELKNGTQLMKRNTRIIANWVLKLKIKLSWCCIILNNMLKKLPLMMEASTSNLNPLDLRKSFNCPRAMRLMTLIKLAKLFVLQVSSTHYPSICVVLDHSTVIFQKEGGIQIKIHWYARLWNSIGRPEINIWHWIDVL
jgi:hypothetical protein